MCLEVLYLRIYLSWTRIVFVIKISLGTCNHTCVVRYASNSLGQSYTHSTIVKMKLPMMLWRHLSNVCSQPKLTLLPNTNSKNKNKVNRFCTKTIFKCIDAVMSIEYFTFNRALSLLIGMLHFYLLSQGLIPISYSLVNWYPLSAIRRYMFSLIKL